jgi:hypothetical protein
MNQYGSLTEPRNTEQNKDIKPHTILVATPVHSDVSMHYTQSLLHLQKVVFS